MRRRRSGFTLIELLVVISIVGLLAAILYPSMRTARIQAKRAVCAANLKQIGIGFRGYLGDNGDRFPLASYFPSVSPLPFDGAEPVYIADVMEPYVGAYKELFKCPDDRPGKTPRDPPAANLSYFQTERSSYEYRTRIGGPLGLPGRTIDEVANALERFFGEPIAVNTIWIMRDFKNFHTHERERPSDDDGGQGSAKSAPGRRNYLYVDGHVADYEKL